MLHIYSQSSALTLNHGKNDQKYGICCYTTMPVESIVLRLLLFPLTLLGPCSYLGNMDLLFVPVVVLVTIWLHWVMLCEVCGDRTGSYVLSQ